MKQSTLDRVNILLKQGHKVRVFDNELKRFFTIYFTVWGHYHGLVNDISSSGKEQEYYARWNQGYMLKNCEEIEIVTPPPLLLKPGDKVEILDTPQLRELTKYWDRIAEKMIGQKGLEVYNVSCWGTYLLYTKDKSNWFNFPTRAVAYCPDDEEKNIDTSDITATYTPQIPGSFDVLDRDMNFMKDKYTKQECNCNKHKDAIVSCDKCCPRKSLDMTQGEIQVDEESQECRFKTVKEIIQELDEIELNGVKYKRID